MNWLLRALQWIYPILLIFAAGSRSSIPSLLYLFAFFYYLIRLPFYELTSNIFTHAVDTTFLSPTVPTGSITPNTVRPPHHAKNAYSSFTISASSSFSNASMSVSGHPLGLPQPTATTTTWVLQRGYFIGVALISGGWLLAQLIIHSLMWTKKWQPDGLSDGNGVGFPSDDLMDILRTLSLAPWPTARDGLQSLVPDAFLFLISIGYTLTTRITWKGRIQWRIQPFWRRENMMDFNTITAFMNGNSHSNSSVSSTVGGPNSGMVISSVSTPLLLLLGFLGCCLFLAAILQPSLLSLIYFLLFAFMILIYVFDQPDGQVGGERRDRMSWIQMVLFAPGSKPQRTVFNLISIYIMIHLTVLHVFQYAIVLSHLDTASLWLGRLGLFVIDTTVWNGVAFIQWIFIGSLIGCLVAISLTWRMNMASHTVVAASPPVPKKFLASTKGTMEEPLTSPVAPNTTIASPLRLKHRSTSEEKSGEFKSSGAATLHPSPSPSISSSGSPPASYVRRSFFSQSSFELKAYLHRSFRNHGLLLIFALIFVQIMMVQDLFNAGTVAILLLCMSLASASKYATYLTLLLRFEILYLIVTSLLKYLWFIPFLIQTDLNNYVDDTNANVYQAFGLVKHIDGFTSDDDHVGSYACLYLLDAILPAILIAAYLIVHQTTAQNLNILNLFNAASVGDTSLIRRFIEHSPELLNVRDRSHSSILHVAAKNGHVATVRLVMDYVDVNAQDRLGNTALHYAYQNGYDSVIHILMGASVKGSASTGGRHGLNLVNPELWNKKGLKPREMKQSFWTKVKRKFRTVKLVVEQFFYSNASKLTLLLLFFVASQSVNLMHLFYFLFFLIFFSTESVARRYWGFLVSYCAVVFLAIYTFSVVEPLYSYDTGDVNTGTDWIRYIGLFAVSDDGSNDLNAWWSKLAIYYGVFVLAVIQKLLYRRAKELGLLDIADGLVDPDEEEDLPFSEHSEERVKHQDIQRRVNRKPSKLQRIFIVLLTYGTLLTVSVIDVSLFHLGYLFIFLLALCIHQFSHHAGKLLSGFWFLCILYCSIVLLGMYSYLLPEFRHWLDAHLNWSQFSLYDIGFRAPSSSDSSTTSGELSRDSILLILLPPTACFVMCVYYLKALWRDVKANEASRTQRNMIGERARSIVHGTSKTGPGRKYATLPGALHTSASKSGSESAPPTTHRRMGSSPPADPSPLAWTHETAEPVEEAKSSTSYSFAPIQTGPSTSINIPESPRLVGLNGTPSASPTHIAPSLVDFHFLSNKQWKRLRSKLNAVYLFCLNLAAHHTTQILTLFVLLRLMFIDNFSLVHGGYLLFLLIWLPLDGRSYDNSLWMPLTLYSVPLILAKYLFQFQGLVSQTDTWQWVGFTDFSGQIIRGLIGDLSIFVLATIGRVANRTLTKVNRHRQEMKDEHDLLQRAIEAEHGGPLSEEQMKQLLKYYEHHPKKRIAHHHMAPFETERKHQPHLATLAESEEETSPIPPTHSQRPKKSILHASEEEERKSMPPTFGKPTIATMPTAQRESPSPSPPPTTAEQLPTYPAHTVSKLTVGDYVAATIRELWRHGTEVSSIFFTQFGLELFLLFLLLTSFARSNALSLIYVLVYVGAWTYFGGRSVFIRSRFIYLSLLVLLGISILWQYLLILGMPPNWLASNSYKWSNVDGVVQEFVLVGWFSPSDLMWDCWTYVLICWFLPAWRAERNALDLDQKSGMCCIRREEESPEPTDSITSSGTTTPPKQHTASLLSAEDRRRIKKEEAEILESQPITSEQMYVPPSLTKSSEVESRPSPQSPSGHQPSIDIAAQHPFIVNLWSNLLFYSCLVIDKAIFLFIFFIGTSHNNLFSCIYLIFSCWYVLQNYLFDLHPKQFKNMWLKLRSWNYMILVAFILYQIPWVPYTFISDANLRWEMTIGFHRFILPPDDSSWNVPAYLRVYTDPLGSRGALPQILIFLLIEIQLLVLQSVVFQTSVIPYFDDIRRLSDIRRESCVDAYKDWLISRIKSILLFREKIEANFTHIFLEASKLNVDYFQDEMVWPQPKPIGWDERVNDLLLEDRLKQYEFQQKKANEQPLLMPSQPSPQPSVGETKTNVVVDSELSNTVQPPTADESLTHAFQDVRTGPLQVSPSPPPASDKEKSLSPETAARTKEAETLTEVEARELVAQVNQQEKAEHGLGHRILRWFKRPLIAYIDPVFWTEYCEDPKTHEFVVISTSDCTNLSMLQTIWRFFLSNTQWICFIFYFINLLVNGNVLAMVIPIGILCYAIFERTRVGPGFWLFCMLYTSIIISLKFVFQLYIFCVTIDTSSGSAGAVQTHRRYIFAPSPYCTVPSASDAYSLDAIFGLRKFSTHTYFTIVLIDMLCLLSIVLHRTMMLSRGLWYLNEEEEMARMERNRIREQEEEEENELTSHEAGDAATSEKPSTATDSTTTRQLTPEKKPVQSFEAELYERGLPPASSFEQVPKSDRKSSSTVTDLTESDRDLQMTLYLLQHEEESQDAEMRKADQATSQEEKKAVGRFAQIRDFLARQWRRWMPMEIQWYYDSLIPNVEFHSVNVHKPGQDYYIYLFVVELVSALWILVCYDLMASTSSTSVSSSLNTNLFSGYMVLTLFVQIILIILDRTCYLFRSVLCKLLIQYGTILYWFTKIFIDWPVSGQTGFTNNSYLQFFFILKLFYFTVSGMQIYTGYPPPESTGFQMLTRHPGAVPSLFYKAYRALPFVFELRTMLDWMCSVTSLDLWDTLKLEEIHGSLYLTQCDILYRRDHERGTPRALMEKFCSGVVLFILLMIIIFGPLLLFSTANPVSQNNLVVSASVGISLTGAQGEYPLVDITSYVLQPITDDLYAQMQNADVIQDDGEDAIQSVTMAPFSDETWSISPPSLTFLMMSLNDPSRPMQLKFDYSFTRAAGPATSKTISSTVFTTLSQETQSQLATLLNSTQLATVPGARLPPSKSTNHAVFAESDETDVHDFHSRHPIPMPLSANHTRLGRPKQIGQALPPGVTLLDSTSVLIPNVAPVYLRLPGTADPIELLDPSQRANLTLSLNAAHQGAGAPIVRWWFVNESAADAQSSIEFITVSDRIFAGPLSNLSYSIVGVYVIVLFTIGQFVRLAFGNQITRIPVDDLPNASKLVQIVEGVYIARQKKQLAKEEILYRRLLKIYRTPALLLILTARQDSEEEKRRGSQSAAGNDDKSNRPPTTVSTATATEPTQTQPTVTTQPQATTPMLPASEGGERKQQ